MLPFSRTDLKLLNPTEMLAKCLDGYYERPVNEVGQRVGPLVGYAGTYSTPGGPEQYVGEVYANFAKAEVFPELLLEWSRRLYRKLLTSGVKDVHRCMGMPMGGISFAFACAQYLVTNFGYLEKKVTETAKEGQREKSKLMFGRHKVHEGERVILVEDVCNNFSTTGGPLS